MKQFVVLAIFVYNIAQSVGDDSTQDSFDVKPGGQTMVYEKEWVSVRIKTIVVASNFLIFQQHLHHF